MALFWKILFCILTTAITLCIIPASLCGHGWHQASSDMFEFEGNSGDMPIPYPDIHQGTEKQVIDFQTTSKPKPSSAVQRISKPKRKSKARDNSRNAPTPYPDTYRGERKLKKLKPTSKPIQIQTVINKLTQPQSDHTTTTTLVPSSGTAAKSIKVQKGDRKCNHKATTTLDSPSGTAARGIKVSKGDRKCNHKATTTLVHPSGTAARGIRVQTGYRQIKKREMKVTPAAANSNEVKENSVYPHSIAADRVIKFRKGENGIVILYTDGDREAVRNEL